MFSANNLIFIVVLAVVFVGAILAPVFISRNRSKRLHKHFGAEYEHTLQALGDDKKTQTALEERQKHIKELEIHPLSASEHERYLAEWTTAQVKFIDEPGETIVTADHLIMEVMQLRGYPVSDFEQRAADVSVSYPALVGNYRAARVIAIKNMEHQANTEELRTAMIYYRSIFNELLETGTEAVLA